MDQGHSGAHGSEGRSAVAKRCQESTDLRAKQRPGEV
jgi:hypothetical protein